MTAQSLEGACVCGMGVRGLVSTRDLQQSEGPSSQHKSQMYELKYKGIAEDSIKFKVMKILKSL